MTSFSPTMTKCLMGISALVRKSAPVTETCNILQCGEPSTVSTVISPGFEHLRIIANFSVSPLNPSRSGQDVNTTRFWVKFCKDFRNADSTHSPTMRIDAPSRNGAFTHVSINFKDLAYMEDCRTTSLGFSFSLSSGETRFRRGRLRRKDRSLKVPKSIFMLVLDKVGNCEQVNRYWNRETVRTRQH